MIGNWKSSLILGLIALVLWTIPMVWYFIGNHRLGIWWGKLRARLGIKPREEPG